MKNKRIGIFTTIALCLALLLILSACGDTAPDPAESQADTSSATEAKTEAVTEAPEEAPTAQATEEATEAPTETPEETTAASIEDDLEGPVYNLIEVGLSGDGKTPCYDGRYRMEYECFNNSFSLYTGSIQEAFDDLEGYGGQVAMAEFEEIGYCFYVNVPDDGNLYIMYYNWAYCDFRFNYGVTYSDQTNKDNGLWITPGYAYYSDLKTLDDIAGLDNSLIYVWDITYGLAPGVYKMIEEPTPEMNYTYERLGDLEEYWPGLPRLLEE